MSAAVDSAKDSKSDRKLEGQLKSTEDRRGKRSANDAMRMEGERYCTASLQKLMLIRVRW